MSQITNEVKNQIKEKRTERADLRGEEEER